MDGDTHRDADFAERLRAHQVQVFGYIYSLVRNFDDADDLFQQTSLAMWNKFDQFDTSRSFVAWACGVARFEVSNFLRARGRQRLSFSDDLSLLLIDAQESLERDRAEDRREALAGCLKKLKQGDQQAGRGLLRRGVARAGGGPVLGAVVAEHPQFAQEDPPDALRMRPAVAGDGGPDMNGPEPSEIPDRLRDLVDDYCADLVDEAGVRELEAALWRASRPGGTSPSTSGCTRSWASRRGRGGRRSAALSRVAIGRRAGAAAEVPGLLAADGGGRGRDRGLGLRPGLLGMGLGPAPGRTSPGWSTPRTAGGRPWTTRRPATCGPARSSSWSAGWPRSSSTAGPG